MEPRNNINVIESSKNPVRENKMNNFGLNNFNSLPEADDNEDDDVF
jgi:hypothetical protein